MEATLRVKYIGKADQVLFVGAPPMVQHEKTFGHIGRWSLNIGKLAHVPSIAGELPAWPLRAGLGFVHGNRRRGSKDHGPCLAAS